MTQTAQAGLELAVVEAALSDPEQPFGAIFDQAGLGLVVTKIDDGTIVLTNPAYDELLGFRADELRGTSFLDHTHPDDLGRNRKLWREKRAGRQPYRIEKRYIRKDGSALWVEVSTTFVADPAGSPKFAFSVVLDITDRKEAEEALRSATDLLQSLVSASPVAIVVSDLEERVTMWNRSAERILGWASEEVLGRPLPFVASADLEESLGIRERVLAGELVLDMEISRVRKDGSRIDLSLSVAPRRDSSGRVIGLVGFMVDIRERVRAKSQLERSLSLLRQTDQQRRDLLAELVRAQDEERRRIAVDIHDDAVQVMVAVGLRLSLLRRNVEGAQAELVDQLEENVSDAIGRLRRLLFDLRPSELERGGLALALRTTLEVKRESAELGWRLDDRLTAEPPLEVRLIAYRIACQAIGNAQRAATARNLEVVLESVGNGVSITVEDDGKGFSPSDDPRFEAGEQIGLVEMRERAELAGGWFRIESAPGGGTTVRFWLPTELETSAAEPADPVLA